MVRFYSIATKVTGSKRLIENGADLKTEPDFAIVLLAD